MHTSLEQRLAHLSSLYLSGQSRQLGCAGNLSRDGGGIARRACSVESLSCCLYYCSLRFKIPLLLSHAFGLEIKFREKTFPRLRQTGEGFSLNLSFYHESTFPRRWGLASTPCRGYTPMKLWRGPGDGSYTMNLNSHLAVCCEASGMRTSREQRLAHLSILCLLRGRSAAGLRRKSFPRRRRHRATRLQRRVSALHLVLLAQM